MNLHQVALVSGGVGECGNKRFPGIYVRLNNPDIYQFIENKTKPKDAADLEGIFFQCFY
jgi:hypothetical protein